MLPPGAVEDVSLRTRNAKQYRLPDGRIAALISQGATQTVFAFDSRGRRASQGTPASPQTARFAYDDADRLVGCSDASRGVSASYAYDAYGQRVRSVVASGSLVATTAYAYDGLSLLRATTARSDGTTESVTCLYDGSGAPFAGIYEGSAAASPVAFFLATAARGDAAELLDSAGAPFALYSYDAYGSPGAVLTAATARIPAALAQAIADANVLRYAGYAYDAHSGLYCLSKRYYDPATAQFLTKDPAKADGEESPYQYCAGDPVGKVDPSGERAKRLSRTHWFTVVHCDVSVWMLSSGTSEFVANEKRSILLPEPKWIGVAELAAHWEFRDGVLRVYGYLRSSTERSSAVMITGRLMRLMRDGRGRRYTAPVPCVRSDSYVSGQKNEAELISFSLRYERSWVSGLTARMKGAGRYSDGVQWPGTVRLKLSNPFGDRRPMRVAASGSAGSRLATDVRYTRLMW